MRCRLLTLGLAIAAGLLADARPSAQQSAPPSKPQTTFRASTHLIVHPVTVKDKQGRPVLGLTAKDFVVTENGVPQNIAFVEYEAIDPSRNSATTAVTTVPAEPPPGCAGPRVLFYFSILRGRPRFGKTPPCAHAKKSAPPWMPPADLVAVML